ncbi:MAG: SRPBCC domain-containing protein [Sulfitobacter sp.]
MINPDKISVETVIHAPIDDVWDAWTTPADILKWNTASDDWHTVTSEVDLRVGGAFSSRMEAKDGSMGFDFTGEYTRIETHRLIENTLGDRHMLVEFEPHGDAIKVRETFEPEAEHSIKQQRDGWQAILDRFAQYVERKQ